MLTFVQYVFTLLLTNIAPLGGVLGLILSAKIFSELKTRDAGNEIMQAIALKIRQGAFIFLKAEYRIMSVVIALIAGGLVFVPQLGPFTAICFLIGALCSTFTGLRGIDVSTTTNVRTAQGAVTGSKKDALFIAFGGGAVQGLTVASSALLGVGVLFWFFGASDLVRHLAGFALGGSLIALFARVGGGIFTKAADIGSDVTGKLEKDFPEDDPRNPGVIADNVGDNVNDVAGMSADLFESQVGSIIVTMILAAALSPEQVAVLTHFEGKPMTFQNFQLGLIGAPLVLTALGLIASIVGVNSVQSGRVSDANRAMRQGAILASGIFIVLAAIFFLFANVRMFLFWSSLSGALCGLAISHATEFFTSRRPVLNIVEASRGGAATNVISGIAVGFHSVLLPVFVIALTVVIAAWSAGLYGIGLAAVSMAATLAMTMSIYAYGPIADNASGIAQISRLPIEARTVTDELDTLGNSTAAVGKGAATACAALTAIATFACFTQVASPLILSLVEPRVLVGLIVGAALPAVISAQVISSVGRAATVMIAEIRSQFTRNPEILESHGGAEELAQLLPAVESGRCVEVATKAALREMIAPGLVVMLVPIGFGFLFGKEALGGLMAGAISTGLILALFMTNAGSAWDNAKKLVESGVFPADGRSSDLHKATIIGDTVGDPLKDTAGPAMNILMKLVTVVALLIAPLL